MKHRFCAAALAAVLLLSAAPLSPAASAAFSDAEGTWAAEVIEKAEGYGLMNGYPDGTFGVGKELTRGEFVAVLCRMFGWDAASPGAPSFSDCPASHWAYSYVETALAHGVMDAGGAFRPEDYISREEMAVMLVRALGYGTLAQSLSGLELPFDDITDNRGYIAIAYDIGMITGVAGAGGQLKFLPRDSATREEAAAMLVRVYERYTSKLDWLHGFYAFSSYSQIDLTASMDAVSVGWARMEYDPAAGPVLNSSRTNGNDWVRPDDPTPATDYWDARSLPYNLNVYASAGDSIPLPDGTTTSTVAAVTGTPEVRAQAVAALAAASADYAGLTIDFEGLKGDTIKLNYVTFLKELDAVLPQGKTLYVCVQPDTWYTGFDYRGIGEAADKVILMAHDYQWTSVPDSYVGTTNTDSPVTPFASVYEALRDLYRPGHRRGRPEQAGPADLLWLGGLPRGRRGPPAGDHYLPPRPLHPGPAPGPARHSGGLLGGIPQSLRPLHYRGRQPLQGLVRERAKRAGQGGAGPDVRHHRSLPVAHRQHSGGRYLRRVERPADPALTRLPST